MRLTRHAKNKMRFEGLSRDDVLEMVLIDVIGTRNPGFEEPLRAAAQRHLLDAEALIAAAHAALAAPDRPVRLEVGARVAA